MSLQLHTLLEGLYTSPQIQWRESKQTARNTEFPVVMSVIDGTCVRIVAPNEHEEIYVNRKNFTASMYRLYLIMSAAFTGGICWSILLTLLQESDFTVKYPTLIVQSTVFSRVNNV